MSHLAAAASPPVGVRELPGKDTDSFNVGWVIVPNTGGADGFRVYYRERGVPGPWANNNDAIESNGARSQEITLTDADAGKAFEVYVVSLLAALEGESHQAGEQIVVQLCECVLRVRPASRRGGRDGRGPNLH